MNFNFNLEGYVEQIENRIKNFDLRTEAINYIAAAKILPGLDECISFTQDIRLDLTERFSNCEFGLYEYMNRITENDDLIELIDREYSLYRLWYGLKENERRYVEISMIYRKNHIYMYISKIKEEYVKKFEKIFDKEENIDLDAAELLLDEFNHLLDDLDELLHCEIKTAED